MTDALFGFTGSLQSWTVPFGVTSVDIEVVGAAAQGIRANDLAVTPGEVFTVQVGGIPTGTTGGWPDGGAGQYVPGLDPDYDTTGGFGSSDVRRGSTSLAGRILVGAGGSGVTITEDGGVGRGDGTNIEPGLVFGSQPGPGDDPRVAITDPGVPGLNLVQTGASGSTTVGAASETYISHEAIAFYLAAGGGGFGGGGASSAFEWDDFEFRAVTKGGRTGGWYAAEGIDWSNGSVLSYGEPGYVVFSYSLSASHGWSVGHIGW